MARVTQVKKNGQAVVGLYKKLRSEGDAYRFVGAEAGNCQIIHINDDTVFSDGRRRVTLGPNHTPPNNTPQYIEFVLKFAYFVGKNQLMVGLLEGVPSGRVTPLLSRTAIDLARLEWADWQNPPYDVDLDPTDQYTVHFQEILKDTVRVVNPGTTRVFSFQIPHTSLQAVSRGRVLVDNQGDNAAVELLGNGDGILLKSRGGRRGLLRIDETLQIGVDPR